jgi:hypothetical protein
MQITTFELIVGLAGLISLGFNFFQLYKERMSREKLDQDRLLHRTTLLSIWQTLAKGSNSLKELEHKGTDPMTISSNMSTLLDSQTISIGQLLQKYYGLELSAETTLVQTPEFAHKLVSPPPNIELITGEKAITEAMINAVENAERFIFVVGGRSRNEAYLNAIKSRVLRGDILYKRVLTGDHIRHPLCRHVDDTYEKVELGYLKEDKYGGILATHNTIILAMLSSNVSILDKGSIIRDESVASGYRVYIQDLLTSSTRPIEMSFVRSLCTTCRQNTLQVTRT